MIVIASDKFKGTLSSLEAGTAIREGLCGMARQKMTVIAMADGGEGTPLALRARIKADDFFEYKGWRGAPTALIPSCGEGLPWQSLVSRRDIPLRERSSLEVGKAIRRAAESGRYKHIDVGIGGTQTADGGLGMLEGMGYIIERDTNGIPYAIIAPRKLASFYRKAIRGLSDICAPLFSEDALSAMSFLAQKGAENEDIRWCKALFNSLQGMFPGNNRYGGAGGGIGFALENIVKCRVSAGAPIILRLALNGLRPELIVSGEGRVDNQTLGGKTVAAVYSYAAAHGIPAVTFCGSMAENVNIANIFPCIHNGEPIPTDPYESLYKTACSARPLIKKLLTND